MPFLKTWTGAYWTGMLFKCINVPEILLKTSTLGYAACHEVPLYIKTAPCWVAGGRPAAILST